MTAFDPSAALDALLSEYSARATTIRSTLSDSHSPDSEEQATQRQNDEVLEALLAEAEEGRHAVGLAKLRLTEGTYGQCLKCAEPIESARLQALPATAYCLACAERWAVSR
ncbi:TraR/DksA family transcriptional regulator [Pseudomonas sp. NPDC078700]|uniref:TraR/DksA family transcriptional regulator n=1 Tax=Pseudomonas sp. NPDC078700 TaxID=3364424 RepID=UPI0037C77F89